MRVDFPQMIQLSNYCSEIFIQTIENRTNRFSLLHFT
jgi:hypothetical protein